MKLGEYVDAHTDRGECKCGRCRDVGTKPDPIGHTADMVFFLVAKKDEPSAAEFEALTKAHPGDWQECDPLDGKEHSYLELGAWLGDQGVALRYMALGSLLGVFDLLTPRTMLPALDEDLVMEMAGAGYITVQRKGAQKTTAAA